MSIALVYSDEYLKHDTGEHPERSGRCTAIVNGLKSDRDLWEHLIKIDPRLVTDEELLRCHTQGAVARVGKACLQASLYSQVSLDADTIVSEHSDKAARLAAGGACRAVDALMTGEAESIFVACRPPGHHAMIGNSMGFCLYNNVAIAARYAQKTYPQLAGRILIVDFDVHHGNGTQDIFYCDPTVFYYSLHQYPWYPGTGKAEERGENEGEGFTLNVPVPAMTSAENYLRMFEEGLESVMGAFSADLIIISAGFDAHESDPLGHLRLTDESYQRMTRRLKEAARATGGGRILSCLEGGYNLKTLGETVRAHLTSLS